MFFHRHFLHVDLFELNVTSGSSNISDDMSNLIDPPNGFASDDEGAVGYDITRKISNFPIPPPLIMMNQEEKKMNGGYIDKINVADDLSDILSEENEDDFREGTTNALKVRISLIRPY